MGNKLSPTEKEFYTQIRASLLLENISVKKRELKAFVNLLFMHFPNAGREEVLSVVFWGKVGRCIYQWQVLRDFGVAKFYPVFDAIYEFVKRKERVKNTSSPSLCSSPSDPNPSFPKDQTGLRSCPKLALGGNLLPAGSCLAQTPRPAETGHLSSDSALFLTPKSPESGLDSCCNVNSCPDLGSQNGGDHVVALPDLKVQNDGLSFPVLSSVPVTTSEAFPVVCSFPASGSPPSLALSGFAPSALPLSAVLLGKPSGAARFLQIVTPQGVDLAVRHWATPRGKGQIVRHQNLPLPTPSLSHGARDGKAVTLVGKNSSHRSPTAKEKIHALDCSASSSGEDEDGSSPGKNLQPCENWGRIWEEAVRDGDLELVRDLDLLAAPVVYVANDQAWWESIPYTELKELRRAAKDYGRQSP
ncbi:uncharacterized protein LOC135303976 [Passer domesticus]|uniref:uncharacterized protein LOC135303976 n=1 Tax=Passer domesticus TaxID=48849 RepID=UPI0030FE2BE6